MTRTVVFTVLVACAVAFWWTRGPAEPSFDTIDVEGIAVPVEKFAELMPHVADSDMFRFDPIAIVRARANQTRELGWSDHPDGKIVVETNNLGLRSGTPTGEPTGRRVLLVGDSHTYGLVNIDECLHSQLDTRLEEHFGEPFEVLNAAIGGTGPFEYAGAVDLFLPLQPEVVVVIMFSGNDFTDVLGVEGLATGQPPSGAPAEAQELLNMVRETWPRRRCLSQGIHQAFRFKHVPEQRRRAFQATLRCMDRIAAACAATDSELIVAMLPTKMDVEPHDDELILDSVLYSLKLTRKDYDIHRRMGRLVLSTLEARGIAVVDPLDAMVAKDDILYWRGDHHLAIRGQEVLADALMPALSEALKDE